MDEPDLDTWDENNAQPEPLPNLTTDNTTDEEDPFPIAQEGPSCPHCAGLGAHGPSCPVGVEKAAQRALSARLRGWSSDPVFACKQLTEAYDELAQSEPDSPFAYRQWAQHWRMVARRTEELVTKHKLPPITDSAREGPPQAGGGEALTLGEALPPKAERFAGGAERFAGGAERFAGGAERSACGVLTAFAYLNQPAPVYAVLAPQEQGTESKTTTQTPNARPSAKGRGRATPDNTAKKKTTKKGKGTAKGGRTFDFSEDEA